MNPQPFSLVYLDKENDLNKVLKAQKKSGEQIRILFTSLWDKNSQKLLKKLDRVYSVDGSGAPIYVANSFTMPHAFVIFKTSIIPHLITLGKNSIRSSDYLPNVYQELRVL